MASNGTNQSNLYDVRRNLPSEQMRDRSMEQSNNSNSGNPHGYIPPTFNPGTGQWDTPLSYTVPTANGVQMPTGPQALLPNFNPSWLSLPQNAFTPNFGPGGTGGISFGGSPIGAQSNQTGGGPVLPGLGNLPPPASGQPLPQPNTSAHNGTPSLPYSNPVQALPGMLPMPKFNDGSTSSTLAQHFFGMSGGSPEPSTLSGFLPRMQTMYSDGAHAYSGISHANDDESGNSTLSQQLRYLKRFSPRHQMDAKAGTIKNGRGNRN